MNPFARINEIRFKKIVFFGQGWRNRLRNIFWALFVMTTRSVVPSFVKPFSIRWIDKEVVNLCSIRLDDLQPLPLICSRIIYNFLNPSKCKKVRKYVCVSRRHTKFEDKLERDDRIEARDKKEAMNETVKKRARKEKQTMILKLEKRLGKGFMPRMEHDSVSFRVIVNETTIIASNCHLNNN